MVDNLYEDLVVKYAKNFIPIKVPKEKVEKIKRLVNSIIIQKQKESIHNIDNKKEFKRFFTGLMGEAAVEELLHLNIIDWSAGNSVDYNYPDIKEYGIGIKTVGRNNFPIIFKENKYPQIICILSNKFEDIVFICGLATVDILNRYQSDLLILSKELYNRGTKTGFYGFCKLKRIQNIEDLK